MKRRYLPNHRISASLLINFCCVFFTIFATVTVCVNTGDAKDQFTVDFNSYYGTDGTKNGTTLGSCITCHNQIDGKGGYNVYGIDYLLYGYDFAAIEPLDSDWDGYDNLTEILTGTFPGDPFDFPAPGNKAPVANAGSNQTVDEGALVTLDGSNSYDPDGTIVSYNWVQTGGMPVTLSDSAVDKPKFTAPQVGPGDEILTFSLTVTDNDGDQGSDSITVTITWVNDPPLADAGPDQTVEGGADVTLKGSNSTDPDDGIASYQWTQTAGPSVILSDSAAVQPTFIAPMVSGGLSLTFQLTVTDSMGLTATDFCIVNVSDGNQPPIASAGDDQTMEEGATVVLDASGSTDPDGSIVSYLWLQTSGTLVTLSNPSAVQPTFTAPDIGSGGDSLTFKLTVIDDGGLQATDSCIVNVTWVNLPPIADAGADQTGASSVEEGSAVTLDGSNSTDPDDAIVSYLWEQTGAGPAVTLSDPTTKRPTFVTPAIDAAEVTLTFQLTVEDSGGLQASDVVSVIIYDNGITGFPDTAITLRTPSGTPIGITEDGGGRITKLDVMDPVDLPDPPDAPEDLIYGLIDLQVKTDTPGAKVTIGIYLAESAPSGYKWYKYNTSTGVWSDYSDTTDGGGNTGAVFNTTRDQIILTLIDGGIGDDDGIPNAIIEDPSGLGAASRSISPAGSNSFGASGSCFINSVDSSQGIALAMLVVMGALLAIFAVIADVRLRK